MNTKQTGVHNECLDLNCTRNTFALFKVSIYESMQAKSRTLVSDRALIHISETGIHINGPQRVESCTKAPKKKIIE